MAVGVEHGYANALVVGVVDGAGRGSPYVACGTRSAGAVSPVHDAVVVSRAAVAVHGFDGLIAVAYNVCGILDYRQFRATAIGIAVVTAGFIQFGLRPGGETVQWNGVVTRRCYGEDTKTIKKSQHHTHRQ